MSHIFRWNLFTLEYKKATDVTAYKSLHYTNKIILNFIL